MRDHIDSSGRAARATTTAPDPLKDMVKFIAESLMKADADALCKAHQRPDGSGRVNSRNGYRLRRWNTLCGTVDLAIPKLRQGTYFPDWLLGPQQVGARALVTAVADCFVHGASLQKVSDLVRALGLSGITDAQVRELASDLEEMVNAVRSLPDRSPHAVLKAG
jgi:transposase-like protein